MSPLRRLLPLLGLRPRAAAWSVLAGASSLGSAVALIGVSAWLIAKASQQPAIVEISLAVVAVRGLGVSRGVFRYLERLVSHDVALRGLVTLREHLYSALAASRPSVVAGLRRGDLLARLGADVDAVGDTAVRGLLPFGVAALVGAGSVSVLAVVLPVAALPLAGGLLCAGALAPWLAARAARRAEVGAAADRARVADQTLALLDGLAELEVAGATERRQQALADAEARLTGHLDTAARPAALAAVVQVLATGLAVLGALLLGAGPAATGLLDPVWYPVLVLVPLAAFEATAALPAAAVELVRGNEAARRLLEVLDSAAAAPDLSPAAAGAGSRPLPPAPHRLTARGLACGWQPDRPVVAGVDLDLVPGTCVAVLGSSGSGKSTLLLTLAGLLQPVEGTIELAGVELRHLATRDLAAAVSFTAEDAHVFATTVRENLRVAAGDVQDSVLLAALHDVGLHDWLRTLPAGLDTPLGSGGHDVSGGERRRLLLARALLTGAGVLLLDEPAEHVDPLSARDLVRDLGATAAATGRTVVIVTHSVAGLDELDEVLELAGGRLRPWARPAPAEAYRDNVPLDPLPAPLR